MQHKTRKQIRQELSATQAELAAVKTPEGVAALLFSTRYDEAFRDAMEAEYDRLRDAADAAALAAEHPATEPPPAEGVEPEGA